MIDRNAQMGSISVAHENLTTDEPVEQLQPHFDFFDPTHAERGPEVMAYARRTCPVMHTTAMGGYYIATSYEAAAQVLREPETFSSEEYVNIAGSGGILMPPIDRDPPVHHDFRLLLNPFFHPKVVAAQENRIREIARSIIATWVEEGSCEFLGDFAGPFVTDVLAQVVFESDEVDTFREAAAINDRVSEGDASAFPEFYDLMVGFVDRSDGSGDGVMAAIINGQVEGRALTPAEKYGTALLLFSGGLDTTKVAISDIVAEIAQCPGLESRLREPGWEKDTLEELLRFSSPVDGLGRVATRDVDLCGQTIKKGERVLVHYQSANFDDSVFESPDELVWGRSRNPHLAFGLGIHRCLGIHMARMQVRAAISELLAQITNITIDPHADLARRPGISRVFLQLPIRFERFAS